MSQKTFQFASKFNPFWKVVAAKLVEKCKKCRQPRLNSIFNVYSTGDKPYCVLCLAASLFVFPLINSVFIKSKLSKEELRKLISNKLIGKSMLNVVRGISHFGLKMPQPTAVPVVIVWKLASLNSNL